jgi:hypothetical protein
MMRIMTAPNSRNSWESYFGERPRDSLLRSLKRQFILERKCSNKIRRRLLLAVNTQIALSEHRLTTRLEEIDASLNLIAAELARRSNDPPPNQPN